MFEMNQGVSRSAFCIESYLDSHTLVDWIIRLDVHNFFPLFGYISVTAK